MKNSIWHLSLALLAGLVMASMLSTPAVGQDNETAPAATPTTRQPARSNPATDGYQPPHLIAKGQGNSNAGNVPVSEEYLRFRGLFSALRAEDDVAKQSEDKGEQGWADHSRTWLQRMSGLTESEAAQVKKVAYQWYQDEEEWAQKYRDAIARIRAAAGGRYDVQSIHSDPEIVALNQSHPGNMD